MRNHLSRFVIGHPTALDQLSIIIISSFVGLGNGIKIEIFDADHHPLA
jgi:hypothetical protein